MSVARDGWLTPDHPRSSTRLTLAALWLGLLAAGCVAGYHAPAMGGLYDRAAQHHGPVRNPVVVIPGMSGSTLVDDASGRVVWGTFVGDYARPGIPADARLLALPILPGASLDELRDGVRADGVLDRVRVRVLGIPVRVRAYVQLLAALGAGPLVPEYGVGPTVLITIM